MIDTIEDIYVKSQEILQTVNDVFNEAGILLPGRQYVLVGDPAYDCAQVTVSFGVLTDGLPGQEPRATQCVNPSTGTFVVDIVREVPLARRGRQTSSAAPDPQVLSEAAKTQMIDAQLLSVVGHRVVTDSWAGFGTYSVQGANAEGAMQSISMEVNVVI